jgi:hypothetical protein
VRHGGPGRDWRPGRGQTARGPGGGIAVAVEARADGVAAASHCISQRSSMSYVSRSFAALAASATAILSTVGGCVAIDEVSTVDGEIASPNGGIAWASVLVTGTTPSVLHSFSSSGDPITVTRTGVGLYTVIFAGQAHDFAGNQGNVEVVAQGPDSTRCAIVSATRTGAPGAMRNLSTAIRCVRPQTLGTVVPADSGFVALYVQDKVGGFASSRGYALVQGEAVVAARSFAPGGAAVDMVPYDVGSYYLFFNGSFPAGGAAPIVTAFGGPADRHCHATAFYPETGELYVSCFAGTTPAAADFSALIFAEPAMSSNWLTSTAHHFAGQTAPIGYNGVVYEGPNYSGTPTPPGSYVLSYPFLHYPNVVLAFTGAMSTGSEYCKLNGYWPSTWWGNFSDHVEYSAVYTRCFDATGNPAAAGISALHMISGGVVIF